MSAKKKTDKILDDILDVPTAALEPKPEPKPKPRKKAAPSDGIEILEPALADLHDLGEIGGNAEVYVVVSTGKVVQGPGVKTEHHYQRLSLDMAPASQDSYRMRWRQQGFERVGGITCQGTTVAHEIWRIQRERYDAMVRRRDINERETASQIGKVSGPSGGDWTQNEQMKTR